MILAINKPTRVIRQSATEIDHILTTSFVNFKQFSKVMSLTISQSVSFYP